VSYRRALITRIALMFGAVAYYVLGYLGLNWFNQTRSYYFDVSLPFERDIPFIPAAAVPYSLVFATVVFAFHSLPVERLAYFTKGAKLIVLNASICFSIFLMMPVRALDRPETVDVNSAMGLFAGFWFAVDQPANLFPSLHVNVSVLCALLAWHHHKGYGLLNSLMALGVALGAIFMRQHYLADIIAGSGIAALTYWWAIGRHGAAALEPRVSFSDAASAT
jgi:hypothetical protein